MLCFARVPAAARGALAARADAPLKRPVIFAAAVAAALSAGLAARAQEAGPKPLLAYTGDVDAVAAGGRSRSGTYVHVMTAGVQAPLFDGWSVTVQGAWTAGSNLSARAIGDVAGVQGPFNTGDGLWLYEVKATWQSDRSSLQLGRLSAGDALPGVAGMGQFVNSAFSSNGGAITVNDPGRAATPASTWGAWGKTVAGPFELRGGALLSDPARMTLKKHGLDFSFHPGEGVIAFGEAVAPVGAGLRAGLGGYRDSARVQAFDGRTVRGDEGWYLWLEKPAPDKGRALSGFAMVQAAPRQDRNLQPLFLIGGLTWQGLVASRPADALSVGATAGRFSDRGPLSGWEGLIEANYRLVLNDHLTARPDLQWVIHPAGRGGGRDALVVGVQLEAAL
jgi:carbohydrate-selective porin OprB